MLPQIRWQPSFSATCLHAAWGAVRGWTIADPRLTELPPLARELDGELNALGLPTQRVWPLLAAHAASIDSNRLLAQTVLRKAIGAGLLAERAVEPLAGRITALEAAVQRAIPDLVEQLALRVRPLQEQWEGRGPGLMRIIGKRTDERLIVETADVLLVHPVFGGAGEAHLQQNAVRIEAVLANPHPELPEVVRLAWLLAQLNCDLPMFGEAVHPERLPLVVQLALLPPVLAAAEEVELVRSTPTLWSGAASAWRIAAPPSLDLATILPAWWQTVEESRPSWAIALAGLDQMLRAAE
jgi:hypothetical protein